MQLSHCRLVVPTLDQAVGVSEDIVDLGVDVVDRVGPAVDVVVGKADRTVDIVVGRADKVSVEVVGRTVRGGVSVVVLGGTQIGGIWGPE